jgi:alcohol dehydrogenase class IV
VAVAAQRGELLGSVRAQVGVLDRQLVDELWPAVDEDDNIVHVEAGQECRRRHDRARRRARPDDDLARWVTNLNARLGLPDGLVAMGVPEDVLPRIAEHTEHDPATETNPRRATRPDDEKMLRASL